MNKNRYSTLSGAAADALQTRVALQDRVALRMAAVLSDGARSLPHDVTERLRFARETALERARAAQAVAATPVLSNGSATLTLGAPQNWWLRFASVLPLVALVGGLVLIQNFHSDSQISAAADVDTELLADELPPTAYSDPGFVEFLKSARN